MRDAKTLVSRARGGGGGGGGGGKDQSAFARRGVPLRFPTRSFFEARLMDVTRARCVYVSVRRFAARDQTLASPCERGAS